MLKILLVFLFLADRASKYWFFNQASGLEADFKLISFFSGKFVNSGGAFSLPLNNMLVAAFTALVLGVLIVILIKRGFDRVGLAVTSVILGAFSNFWDRILYGGVIDYLGFMIGNLPSSTFNLADIMIIGGLVYWWRKG